jgi:porphobilinogen synthase
MGIIDLSRLRKNRILRDGLSQTRLDTKDLILPYFVREGSKLREPIKSMPGVYRFSLDELLKDIAQLRQLRSILLFGICEKKDLNGSSSYSKNGVVQKAVRAIKKEFKNLVVITDVCLCGYLEHGHCGILKNSSPVAVNSLGRNNKLYNKKKVIIDKDKTLAVLAKIALAHAQAGADAVAPSAMCDGQVRAIRDTLDKHGLQKTAILAYSAKYASNFYGPFRDALNSSPKFGDRKTYQLDFRNSDGALREIEQDINEGADIVMVKPALGYLDIIYRARQKFNLPLAAYNVSGEYAMLKKISQGNPQLEKDLVLETLTAIKRAGADFIITYFAKDIARWLTES